VATAFVVLVTCWPDSILVQAGAAVSLAVAVAILASARRTDMRSAPVLAAGLTLSLALAHVPLFLTFLDVPPAPPKHLASGRILASLHVDPHPVGPATFPESPTRLLYRRAPAELWPLTATQATTGYAFDEEPDGAFGTLRHPPPATANPGGNPRRAPRSWLRPRDRRRRGRPRRGGRPPDRRRSSDPPRDGQPTRGPRGCARPGPPRVVTNALVGM